MYDLSNPVDFSFGDPSGVIVNSDFPRVLKSPYSFIDNNRVEFTPKPINIATNNTATCFANTGNVLVLKASINSTIANINKQKPK